jgi:hypothetical protein
MRAESTTSAFKLCPVLNDLVLPGCVVGKSGRIFKDLGALTSRNTLETIHRLMLHLAPARTLEIGLAFGGSALVICATHKALGHQSDCQHVVIDPYQRTVWDSCGLLALDRAALSHFVDFREQPSALVLPKMLEDGTRFSLVYIDGSHLFEDVFVDAYYVVRLLALGGIVAFDDSTNPHIAKVLGFLRGSIGGALEEVDLRPFRDRHARFPYRFARLLGKVQLTAFRRVGNVERAWNAPFSSF